MILADTATRGRNLGGTIHDANFFQSHGLWDHQTNLFECVPEFSYFVKDKQLRYVAVNKNLANNLGLKHPEDALGRTDSELQPESLAKAYEMDDFHVILTGEPLLNKVERVARGNSLIHLSTTTKVPLRDASGKIQGVAGITRPFSTVAREMSMRSELEPALEIIKNHFQESFPVSKLAKAVNMSESAFTRKFKKRLRMTPREYIRHIRVLEASHQIAQGTATLSEIAHNCGFCDQSHLSKEFSRIIQETPKAYRNRHRAD